MAFIMHPTNIQKIQTAMAVNYLATHISPIYAARPLPDNDYNIDFAYMPALEFFKQYIEPSVLWKALNEGLKKAVREEQRWFERERRAKIKKCMSCDCREYL